MIVLRWPMQFNFDAFAPIRRALLVEVIADCLIIVGARVLDIDSVVTATFSVSRLYVKIVVFC